MVNHTPGRTPHQSGSGGYKKSLQTSYQQKKSLPIFNHMNSKTQIKIFLGLLFSVILFHICIIVKIIPYNIAWGGRLTNDNEMYVFESISILINIFLSWLLLMKGEFVQFKFPNKTINLILWIFFALFILNTVGNLFAKTNFEKLFALLTGLSAILIWNILKHKKTTYI
jgi:hypothetical protein